MKVIELIDRTRGIVELDGARYGADLSLIDEPQAGQYVIVHAGYAIETLELEEAEDRLALFERMAGAFRTQDASRKTAGNHESEGQPKTPDKL